MYGPGTNIVHVLVEGQNLDDLMPMPCCGMTMKEALKTEGHQYTATDKTVMVGEQVACVGAQFIGTGTKFHIVHKFNDVTGKATCCGVDMGFIKNHNTNHTWTTKDVLKSSGSVWCSGHLAQGNGLEDAEPVEEDAEPVEKNKTHCLTCGYPRTAKGVYDIHGLEYTSPGTTQGVWVYDQHGEQTHCICSHHCPMCHQPTQKCVCCPKCTEYPCVCGQVQKITSGPPETWIPSPNEYLPPPSEVSTHSTKKHVPKLEWMCKVCKEHYRHCLCEEGPTDYTGCKVPPEQVRKPSQCMPVPWIRRGEVPALVHVDVDQAWPNINPHEHDPVEWSADFYLYHALTSGGLNTQCGCDDFPKCGHQIVQMVNVERPYALVEARYRLDALIEKADLVFREYIDMACGGELRHHPSVCDAYLHGSRVIAWANWRDVRNLLGTQALLDMEELFLDYSDGGGGIAGPKWANATRLLYSRLTGRISKETFVDQTFSLVHNGGVFLNKRQWKCGDQLNAMQDVVLPAQAADDYDTLLAYASAEAKESWREGWRAINYCRIRAGVKPIRMDYQRGLLVCCECGLPSTVGHMRYTCASAATKRIRDKSSMRIRRARYWPNFSWDMKEVRFYANSKEYKSSIRPNSLGAYSPEYRPIKSVLADKVVISPSRKFLTITDYDRTFFKVPVSKFHGQEWTIRDLIEIHGFKIVLKEVEEGSDDD